MSPDSTPTLAYGVCDDHWTGLAGFGVVARLTRFLGLPEKLAAAVRLKHRRRGGSDGQILLALIYSACAGGGHLHAADALGTDDVARQACGLRAVPDSRRLGAYLQRMHEAMLEGLRQYARLVSRRLVPLVAQACVQRWVSVPVCGDGSRIEVDGKLFENAERGYHGEQQSWPPSVCVGAAWGSTRLNAGGHGREWGLAGAAGPECGTLADRAAAGGTAGRQRTLLQGAGELLSAAGQG